MGKGGGKVQVSKYFMSQHFGICWGPVDSIRRILIKEKVAWTGRVSEQISFVIDQGELFGGKFKEGGAEGVVYYLPGNGDQVLDDELAQKLGRSGGTDCPGYRGIASAFFVGPVGSDQSGHDFGSKVDTKRGFYWSANIPYLPGVWITVERAPVGLTAAYARILRPGSSEHPYEQENTGQSSGGDFAIGGDWMVYPAGANDLEWWHLPTMTNRGFSGDGNTYMNNVAVADDGTAYYSGIEFVALDVWFYLYITPPLGATTKVPFTDNPSAFRGTTRVFDIGGERHIFHGSPVNGYVDYVTFVSADEAHRDFCRGPNDTVVAVTQPDGSSDEFSIRELVGEDGLPGDSHTIVGIEVRADVSTARICYSAFFRHYFVTMDGNWYTVDDTAFTIKDSGSAAWTLDAELPWNNPSARSFWYGLTERSLEDASVLRTLTASDWVSEASVGVGIYDPVNHGNISRATPANHLTFRLFDRGDFDANPAHMIFEALTNTDWGMGSPEIAIDVDSFEEAGITLFDDSFGLSMIWTRQSTIQDFVQEVLDHIQAVLYVDPATGLLTLKLIRGDYDPDDLPEINPSNGNLSNFARKLWGDITNEISVTWTSPETEEDETVTVHDLASIAAQGGIVSASRNYYGVRNPTLASQLAQRDLRSAGAPLASCEAEVDRTLWRVRPASVFSVVWPEHGLDGIVMRVMSVDYGKPGDMTIKLALLEDVFGLDVGEYIDPPTTSWDDTSSLPAPLTYQEVLTLPMYMARQAGDISTAAYPDALAGALGSSSDDDTFSFDLWSEQPTTGDPEWQDLGTFNIAGHAVLDADLGAEATSTGVIFDTLIGEVEPTVGGFAIIGDDGEEGNELALITAGASTFSLKRGVLDTTPRAWPAGTPVWFVDSETIFEDLTRRSAGEEVEYKFRSRTSLGLLPLELAPLVTHTLTERPWLPNRPANILIDSVAFNTVDTPVDMIDEPEVPVAWVNRNRLLEDSAILSWTDATVAPEAGQTTTITVYAPDGVTVLGSHTALSGTSFDVPAASFDGQPVGLVAVGSERTDDDGTFASLQAHGIFVRILSFDYFAQNGATLGFIGNANYPGAFYDSSTDTTWVAWEAWDGAQRVVFVQTRDHALGRWSKPVIVSTDALTNDDHGPPVLCRDHEGYVHCFWKAHDSALKHAVTTAPDDPSEWTQLPDIGTDLTYPHPVRMGGALYLFARGNGLQSLVRYKTTALSGGVPTWGAQKNVAEFTGGRFYIGDAVAVGTDIHLIGVYSDAGDTFRRDVYHFVYDTTDESVGNSDGSTSTAVGSQPVSKATADTSYIVVNQTTNVTDVPAFCRTSNGDLHLAFIDDSATPYDVKYARFNGTVWSAPSTVTTLSGSASFGFIEAIALVPRSDGSVDLFYPHDPTAAFVSGGDMKRITRSVGGVWGSSTTLLAADTKGLGRPFLVRDADEDLFLMFTETAVSSLDADAGGLRLYGYGANGFVGADPPAFTTAPVISNVDGFFGDGDLLTVAFEHTGTSETYQWNADGVAIGGATAATFTLTAAEVGADITVTVTASNFVGDTNATSASVGPVVTPTYELQFRTVDDLSTRTVSDLTDRTISNRIA